jgi:hypothetical protein
LDIFSVRFPFGDPDVNEKLWNEIDEQQFSPELRERLTRNGLRAGLLSGPLPAELSKLLQLSSEPPAADKMEGVNVDDLAAEPRVTRRHLQLRPRQPSQILASGVYEQLPVLMCASGQLCGQTYNQAQCVFSLKSFPQLDGRVRLEMAPELHHGQPRQEFTSSQGVLRFETGRRKQVFDNLTLTADLAGGAMLIVSSLPSHPGSLGHYFFTQNKDEQLEQKLLVVRLSQTQNDGLFDAPAPLKLDQQ